MAAGGTALPSSPALHRHLQANLLPELCRASTAFPPYPGGDSMMVSGIISLTPSSDTMGVKPISVLCPACHLAEAFMRGQVSVYHLPRAGILPFPTGIPNHSQTLGSHQQHAQRKSQVLCSRLAPA